MVLSVKNTGAKQFKWIYENYPRIKDWSAPSVFTEMLRLGLYSKKSRPHDSVMSIEKYMGMIKNEASNKTIR